MLIKFTLCVTDLSGCVKRNRTLRKSKAIREMVAESSLAPSMFLAPLFITEGDPQKEEISSMPGYFRGDLDNAARDVEQLLLTGVSQVLLFAKVPNEKKTHDCVEAIREDGLLPRSVQFLKKRFSELTIMTDVALDPFSAHGHDGLVADNGEILNDETIALLAQMSVVHAQAGADFVAPSDMMDGRIAAIRDALNDANFIHTGILSYSAKYASCFYGPFRDALDSAPAFGDKRTYQMDPRNRIEAIRETMTDIDEGADIVMVKPAGAYLDIIREVKNAVTVPVAAYQVSGEYAMIKAASQRGWLAEDDAILESLMAIRRAGADIIATYFALQASRLL